MAAIARLSRYDYGDSGIGWILAIGEATTATPPFDETGNNNTSRWDGIPQLGSPGAISGNTALYNVGVVAGAVVEGPFRAMLRDVELPMPQDADPFAMRVLDLGDGPLTMEAWINCNGGIGGLRGIVSKGNGAYYMRLDGTNSLRIIKSMVVDMGGTTIPVPSTGWHHVVATKNAAVTKLYIDGVDRTGTIANATMVNNSSLLYIGGDIQNGWPGEIFNGGIDEVAIYNQVLTPAQVLEHFNARV